MSDRDPTHLDAVVVGGGVTGLALGVLLTRRRPEWRVRVLERESRAGGKVGTLDDGGYRTDTGPLGVLPDPDGALPLARELGLAPVPADPAAARRWIYRDGGLRPLPGSPRAVLASELVGPLGKLRAAAEPFVPASHREETVYSFLARRFGHPVADALAEALVAGVSAGDPHRTSIDALFPRMRALEREHGSLLRGMISSARRSRARRREGRGADAETAHRGGLHAFGAAGMGALVAGAADALGPALHTRAGVRALTREADGWRVTQDDGSVLRTRRVALTVPAYAAAPLLRALDAELAAGLAALPYAAVRVVGLGYDRIDVAHPLDGFGFLAPAGRGIRSLGVLFGSSLFPGLAPAGKVHLRAITGGVRDPAIVSLDRDEAVGEVRRDLRIALGVGAEPESVTVVDWPRAIPQYELGHRTRVEALLARAAAQPGLQLAGAAYSGAGVNDCVRDARRVATAWTGEAPST